MKIAYRKKHVNVNLLVGTIWLACAILHVYDGQAKSYDYVWFLFAATYYAIFFYKKNQQYLTIENGFLKENWPHGKIIKLSEINRIKTFAGDYILKTDEKELKINTQIISPTSFEELKKELEKLNLDWKK